MDAGSAPGLGECVAELIGADADGVPADPNALNEYLAARGLILAAVADPVAFAMPGAFLGRFQRGWAVLFGVPPGPIWDPLEAADDLPPLEAAVLVPLQLPAVERQAAVTGRGRVELITIAPSAEAPMVSIPRARAIAGAGLEGDRYASGAGTFSRRGGSGRDLTLIEREALDELANQGIDLEPMQARRNLLVSGIDLDSLIGRPFRIGAVRCQGARRCEPCAHLQRLTVPGVLRGLVHRGGLRADLLGDGEITVGDEIVTLDEATAAA